MTDLPALLELVSGRLRSELGDALANAEAWRGAGFSSGGSVGGRGGDVSRPTENAALARTQAAVVAAEDFPAALKELGGHAKEVLRLLDALKVVLPVEPEPEAEVCDDCGNVITRATENDRPRWIGCEVFCPSCYKRHKRAEDREPTLSE